MKRKRIALGVVFVLLLIVFAAIGSIYAYKIIKVSDDAEIFNVVYKDDVVNLLPGDVINVNAEKHSVTVSQEARGNLSEGQVVLFPTGSNGLKTAGRIENVSSDGEVALSEVELADVFQWLEVKENREITFADIYSYYKQNDDSAVVLSSPNLTASLFDIFIPKKEKAIKDEKKIVKNGFSLTLTMKEHPTTKKNSACVIVANQKTGETIELYDDKDYKINFTPSATLNINSAAVSVDVRYTNKDDIKKAEAGVNIDSDVEIKVNKEADVEGMKRGKADGEAKIKLTEFPVPLGEGLVGVDVAIYLVVSAEGEVSITAEIPVEMSVRYKNGKFTPEHNIRATNPKIIAEAKAEVALRVEPVLKILEVEKVFDAEFDVGIYAGGKALVRPTMTCVELTTAFPIITIGVGQDDDIESGFLFWKDEGTVAARLGVQKEWKIMGMDDDAQMKPKFINDLHLEKQKGGGLKIVKKCTYKEGDESGGNNSNEEEAGAKNTATSKCMVGFAWDDYDVTFQMDYPSDWEIVSADAAASGMDEIIRLTNGRGVEVFYVYGDLSDWENRFQTPMYEEFNIEKIDDADLSLKYLLEEYPDMASSFVLAKLTSTGTWRMGVAEQMDDGGETMYAILPPSALGSAESRVMLIPCKNDITLNLVSPVMITVADEALYIGCFARSSDGTFTEDEEKDVCSILKSFREIGSERGEF